MVTAEDIFIASGLAPDMFGEGINPELDDEAQRVQAIAYIETHIRKGAVSEVSVPFRVASDGYPNPLPGELIEARWPRMTTEAARQPVIDEISELYGQAVHSFARAEINKQVRSDAKEYDEDADDDRKTARDQLKKLIEAVTDIVKNAALSESQGIYATAVVLNDPVYYDEYGGAN